MGILRSVVERLSRDKILKRRIRVNNKLIPILVTPDAQLKYLKPGARAFDQDLITIAEEYLEKDSNVWDVGANIGVFTFAASTVAYLGNIVSIEADIWLARILNRTSELKQYSANNIFILPIAVSNENAISTFLIAARGRASNALEDVGGRSQMGGVRSVQYTPTYTLDSLLEKFPSPDFIKIDIEGAELLAIQGAKHIIERVRPVFYIEVGENVSEKILNIFKTASYIVLNNRSERVSDVCTRNVFCIPKEKYE